jgi:dTDP-4-dehydrorhamnose 3,5-epimerase
MPVRFEETDIPGVVLCVPDVLRDARGFFFECYRAEQYRAAGIADTFVQDNRSCSRKGVLRGLHFQLRRPQAKLIACLRGEIFDVAVDVRVGSPTFGKWSAAVLSEANHHQLYVPGGFAHGFCVLSEEAEIQYKCSDYYDPADDRGVRWNDPELGIAWPVSEPVLSAKDMAQPFLKSAELPALPARAAMAQL